MSFVPQFPGVSLLLLQPDCRPAPPADMASLVALSLKLTLLRYLLPYYLFWWWNKDFLESWPSVFQLYSSKKKITFWSVYSLHRCAHAIVSVWTPENNLWDSFLPPCGVLGVELRSSGLHGKYSICWAILPSFCPGGLCFFSLEYLLPYLQHFILLSLYCHQLWSE